MEKLKPDTFPKIKFTEQQREKLTLEVFRQVLNDYALNNGLENLSSDDV